jgi:hypothetical protein
VPLYLLQFYRTSPAVADESWEDVNAYVQVSFAPAEAADAVPGEATGISSGEVEESPASGSTGA